MTQKKPPALRTIDITPIDGHQVMPREVVELDGLNHWNLTHHRVWKALMHQAWGPELDDPNNDFEIDLAELRRTHNGNDRIRDVLEVLQKTIVVHRLNGRVTKVQMLGMTNMDDDDREAGRLRYDFPKKLVSLLRSSTMYGQIDMKIQGSYTSKYSMKLDDLVAARINLRQKNSETVTVDQLRRWFGVPDGKLHEWYDFNRKAIQPALAEVNLLSRYQVSLEPVKRGKKVVSVFFAWSKKPPGSPEEREAVAEVNRHRDGRKARLAGTVPQIVGITHTLRPDTLERAKVLAVEARLDVHGLETAWQEWVSGLKTPPDNPDAHFVSFVKTKCQKFRNTGRV